jgi:hypothetical protein
VINSKHPGPNSCPLETDQFPGCRFYIN